MRTTHETTSQTTCDGDDFCPEYVMTAFFKQPTPEQLAARHLANVTEEGWTDLEGRDYCPDHTPTAAHNTQTRSTQ